MAPQTGSPPGPAFVPRSAFSLALDAERRATAGSQGNRRSESSIASDFLDIPSASASGSPLVLDQEPIVVGPQLACPKIVACSNIEFTCLLNPVGNFTLDSREKIKNI